MQWLPRSLGLLILALFPMFAAQADGLKLHVYKDPNCGCCTKWMDHLESEGFEAAFTNTSELNLIKQRFGIGPQYRSCHTAISQQGYIFEGHIPAGLIQQFLKSPPGNALGLVVPGMPMGSPGMEVGDKFMPYKVMLLMKDGSTREYADINRPELQYSLE